MVNEATEEVKCTHHWVIDSYNVGICRYCKQVKDFSKFLKGESRLLGLKSASSKAETGARRSAAARKRWQNPAFRAKMSAVMKGRRHKKEPLF